MGHILYYAFHQDTYTAKSTNKLLLRFFRSVLGRMVIFYIVYLMIAIGIMTFDTTGSVFSIGVFCNHIKQFEASYMLIDLLITKAIMHDHFDQQNPIPLIHFSSTDTY
jgi:hypothetical protein